MTENELGRALLNLDVAPPATSMQPVDGIPMAVAAMALAGFGAVAVIVLPWRRPLVRRA